MQDADAVAIHYPYVQRDQAWIRFGELVIEVEGDPTGYVQAMHAAVWSVDPRVPLDQVLTLEQRVDRALSSARFLASLMIGCGALALALAMQGLFAVVAYSVAQMRTEIALRIMLGATRARAVRFALNDGARAIALGVVAGTAAAFLGAGALEAHLFGVSARDPVTVAAIAALLAAVALLAAWVPARNASRIAPMEALRDE